jgi:hypothetical protein
MLMARYHLHREDEAGTWNCSGPYRDMDHVIGEVNRIIKVKKDLGEKWRKADPSFGYILAWSNEKGHKMSVKED